MNRQEVIEGLAIEMAQRLGIKAVEVDISSAWFSKCIDERLARREAEAALAERDLEYQLLDKGNQRLLRAIADYDKQTRELEERHRKKLEETISFCCDRFCGCDSTYWEEHKVQEKYKRETLAAFLAKKEQK